MKNGVYTALITPFNEDGEIDYDAMKNLVEYQVNKGVAGILISGTTGESPTITDNEKWELMGKIKEWIDGRCHLMVGTGTNSTSKSIEASKKAEALGADSLLIVNPLNGIVHRSIL